MSLTPAEERQLDVIGAALLRTDPGLARRLGASVQDLPQPCREPARTPPPTRRLRALVVGVIVWTVVGLLPLVLGLALSLPDLTAVGVATTIFGIPLALTRRGSSTR